MDTQQHRQRWVVSVVLLASFFCAADSLAQPDQLLLARRKGKKVDVDQIKRQYWRQGEDVDVVQNRLYSKKRKMQFGLFGGSISTDPFLSVRNAGAMLGYHFSEYFSFHLLFHRDFAKDSSAAEFLRVDAGAVANTNEPVWYAGGEGAFSLIYGKLSLFGIRILYFDMMLMAGGGLTDTFTGRNFTLHGGFTQQVYLTQALSFLFQYRLMHYKEIIVDRDPTSPTQGQQVDSRSNFTTAINLGLAVMF